MGLRPGRCYSSTKDRAYTRYADTVQHKNFIGAVPGLKTRQFNMGNGMKEFDTVADLCIVCAPLGMQIRDNAIESTRLMVNRQLFKRLGKEEFFLKVRAYPHHILRENKQAQGAHADRIQKGMSHAFGKAIGRAIRVRDGQVLFSVLCMDENAEKAKECLETAVSRLPCRIKIHVHKDIKSIGTKPKKTRDLKEEEDKAAAEAAAGAATEGAAPAEVGKAAAGTAGAKTATGPAKTEAGKPAAGAKTEAKPAKK
ncbi:50S ribosomal protein L10e [uncultured archaeon]|nr:50S ribosomal protein L10e [uncultured archaeon]